MDEWLILSSKSDKHPEYGYPMGQILCRSKKEADEHIKNSPFKDIQIKKYEDKE